MTAPKYRGHFVANSNKSSQVQTRYFRQHGVSSPADMAVLSNLLNRVGMGSYFILDLMLTLFGLAAESDWILHM
ncbi:hypothetical protein CWB72_13820 [Pseudoalteromonas phenolica]|nr:hypothetical protein CWB72_13820 [Pseudoalteromonas phenolica]